MDNNVLLELAYSRLLLPREELTEDIAFLLSEGLTGEQIFFAINYTAREFPSEAHSKGLGNTVIAHKEEVIRYYELAKAKQAQAEVKGSEKEYDSRNVNQAKNTPSWFRKSFDKHLFK